MEIRFNVTGKERKALVTAAGEILGAPMKYMGAPTFAYIGGSYTIDRNGTLTGDGSVAEENNSRLIKELNERGFIGEVSDRVDTEETVADPETQTYRAELSDPDCPDRMEIFGADDDKNAIRQAQEFCIGEIVLLELSLLDDDYNEVRGVEVKPNRLVLQMPLDGFTPEKIDNLTKLVIAKTPLLKAALDAKELPIQQKAETLDFPWFRFTDDNDTVEAYSALVSLLCKTAMEKNRVTSKVRDVENPKYAMRCFLLSLGFIGDEYKAARKILLSQLEGNSSRKSGKKTEVTGE